MSPKKRRQTRFNIILCKREFRNSFPRFLWRRDGKKDRLFPWPMVYYDPNTVFWSDRILEFNAFALIQNGLQEELSQQGFGEATPMEDPAGQAVMFSTDEVAYSLLYDEKQQRFQLRSTTLDEDGMPGEWKGLSLWLFDPQEGTRSDAESILADFLEVVQGPKRVALVQQQKKHRGKDEDRSVDPLFFLNRLVNLFPQLKDAMNEERILYGQVRYVTFVKENVLPLCEELAQKRSGGDVMKKLCALLDDMYKNGDMDVRSIVTFTLLNGLSDGAFEKVREQLGEELQKSMKYSRKLRGRKIKPEKKKKQKKVVAKLDAHR